MSRSLTALSLGLSLVTSLALAERASAEPKKLPAIGRAFGQVTSFNPVAGTQTVVAMGRGSIIGPHTSNLITYFDFATGEAWGSYEITAHRGPTSVVGTYAGFFQPIDGTPLVQFFLTVTFEDGSGRLEGVSGEAQVVAVQNLATGEVAYQYRGTFEFDH